MARLGGVFTNLLRNCEDMLPETRVAILECAGNIGFPPRSPGFKDLQWNWRSRDAE